MSWSYGLGDLTCLIGRQERYRFAVPRGGEAMRKALVVWGGWEGHEPEQGAAIVRGMLEEDGFSVVVENTTKVFADPAIRDLSLIVPIITMSKIEKAEALNLASAVESGVGL